MRNLGRKSEPMYPLLGHCFECKHVTPRASALPGYPKHFPWCSKAPPADRARWARRAELRRLRTIGRLK